MSEKRQKIWNKAALKARVGSEASDGVMRGTEAQMAINETESLAVTEQLMKEVLDKGNLEEALKQVMQNKGAAGIDGMTVLFKQRCNKFSKSTGMEHFPNTAMDFALANRSIRQSSKRRSM
jgi:shikimate 5-dehydrogenase